MSSEVVISVRNVGKTYRIWTTPAQRLLSPSYAKIGNVLPGIAGRALHRISRAGYRDFHALRNVDLELRRGEALGVIGLNGSGKSTLLQIIAGTLQPTTGQVEVRGRVAALLELGSGFNPEFTGRENVYLTAGILGLTRQETDERFDTMAAFADIGEFIEEPIKTYSSGMVMRLAFAVAAHVSPDILIIDEALSVGDSRFQLKCARAIDRFMETGLTLLFVSHDTGTVKRLCQSAILMNQGRVLYSGPPNDVVNLYSKLSADGGSEETLMPHIATLRARAMGPAKPTKAVKPAAAEDPILTERAQKLLSDERTHVQISGEEFSYGGELGRIHRVAIVDSKGELRTWFSSGESIVARMVVAANDDFSEPIFALTVKNTAGVEIYGTNTLFSKQPAAPIKAGGLYEVDFTFELNVMPGDYFLSFGFTHFVGEELVVLHRRYDAVKIEVHGLDRTFGIANLKARISSRPAAP
jgi:ABC-type polysaccharide/polyol phosphate transport system ATPase subunit